MNLTETQPWPQVYFCRVTKCVRDYVFWVAGNDSREKVVHCDGWTISDKFLYDEF